MIEPFLATYSGGKFFPLGPDPERVKIEDIAHALSNLCRYAGHVSRFWSVAAHSLEVSHRIEDRLTTDAAMRDSAFNYEAVRRIALTGLMHDASEAYLIDIPRPLKPLVFGYKQWEENVERAIATRFGLAFPWAAIVKEVDDEMIPDEVANFFSPGSAAWERYHITTTANHPRLTPLTPPDAEADFLARFVELGGKA